MIIIVGVRNVGSAKHNSKILKYFNNIKKYFYYERIDTIVILYLGT